MLRCLFVWLVNPTENRQHSVSDQLTSIGNNAATHDAKGNLTAYEINGKEYEVDYDLDNRIIKADIDGDDVEYRYDAFGRRVIRKEGSTKTALIWWSNSECAEYKHSSGQASIQNDLFAHPTRLNAVIARAVDGSKSKLQWYHKNYLDHVYAVSDDDGDILEYYRYTAFGEVTIYNATGVQQTTTQINNQILWNTRRRDTVSGYYMYKFRHYSPELGRWPSRDPIEEQGGVNLYGFVGNEPMGRWDLLGLEPDHSNITLLHHLNGWNEALQRFKLEGGDVLINSLAKRASNEEYYEKYGKEICPICKCGDLKIRIGIGSMGGGTRFWQMNPSRGGNSNPWLSLSDNSNKPTIIKKRVPLWNASISGNCPKLTLTVTKTMQPEHTKFMESQKNQPYPEYTAWNTGEETYTNNFIFGQNASEGLGWPFYNENYTLFNGAKGRTLFMFTVKGYWGKELVCKKRFYATTK